MPREIVVWSRRCDSKLHNRDVQEQLGTWNWHEERAIDLEHEHFPQRCTAQCVVPSFGNPSLCPQNRVLNKKRRHFWPGRYPWISPVRAAFREIGRDHLMIDTSFIP